MSENTIRKTKTKTFDLFLVVMSSLNIQDGMSFWVTVNPYDVQVDHRKNRTGVPALSLNTRVMGKPEAHYFTQEEGENKSHTHVILEKNNIYEFKVADMSKTNYSETFMLVSTTPIKVDFKEDVKASDKVPAKTTTGVHGCAYTARPDRC